MTSDFTLVHRITHHNFSRHIYSKSANQNIGGEETQGAMTPKPESAGMEDSRGTCTL